MSNFWNNVQPAVKTETKKVAASTIIGVLLMWIVFAILHGSMPEKIPLDYTVFLGGICGGVVAVLNFLLMGLTVQKVAATDDQDTARARMKASYSQRMMLQILWIVVAIVAPCFQFTAGIVPLLLPSIGIKIMGIIKNSI